MTREYSTKIIRKKITVHGWVQGVGFRYRTVQAAERVGATGWIHNNPDGSVTMEIQGTQAQIDDVFEMVQGGMFISIENREEELIPPVEREHSFWIDE